MPTYVCLLRGINVGGRNRVAMAPLRSLFESLGFTQVKSYLQSGNILFAGSAKATDGQEKAIQAHLEASLGFSPIVVLRSSRQFSAAAESHPFYELANNDLTKLQVAFLSREPKRGSVDAIELPAGSQEQFRVRGREVFVLYPNGVARSKVTGQFWESRLQQPCTMRNWKTVRALAKMAGDS